MRKRKNEIITTIKNDISSHAKAYFIVVIIFTVGVFLGVLFVNQKESKEDIEKKEKEISFLKASIEKREKLLANENFVKKAPEKLVKEEQEKLEAEKQKLSLLEK